MNIDDLTIGQARELSELFGNKQTSSNFASRYVGKYVIVRSIGEGINFGEVVQADATGVILKNSIRLWRHRPLDKNSCWYEGVANSGLAIDSQISVSVEEKAIIEKYSITLCTDVAVKSIKEHTANAQS